MITFPILLAVSLIAGFIGSLSGMGGGVILIPVLTFLGLDIKKVIAVSIVSVIATSSGAAAAYVKDRLTNLKVGMFLEVFTIIGGWTGALLTVRLSQSSLYILFGSLLLISWGLLLVKLRENSSEQIIQDKFSSWLELEGEYYDQALSKTIRYKAVRAYFGAPLMLLAGLLAGLLGIGAGAVKVLIHDLVMKLPPKVSTSTSNLIIGVTALSGASVYLAKGLIDPGLAAPVIVGVSVGAFSGTRILNRLKNENVRRIFLIILIVFGVEMIIRGINGG